MKRITMASLSVDKISALIIAALIAVVSEETLLPSSVQKLLWIVLAVLGIAQIARNFYKNDYQKYFKFYLLAAAPFLIASAYTVIYCLATGDSIGTMKQAISTTMFIVVDLLMVAALVFTYRKKSADVMFLSVIFAYAITFVKAIVKVGFSGMLSYLKGDPSLPWDFNKNFERHDLGVAVVPLILFYIYMLYKRERSNKELIIRIVMLFAVLFLCGKRSALVALAAGLMLMAIITMFKHNRLRICVLALAVTGVAAYLYVALIQQGFLSAFCDALNINSMGRVTVYEHFNDTYNMSPLYFGKGFQYIHCYMTAGLGTKLVNDFEYLHNSILQIYIETGFFGFVMWFGMLLAACPMLLKRKFSRDTLLFYVITIISTVVMFTTDNVLTYPVFQVCLYTTICAVEKSKKDNTIALIRRDSND